MRAVVRSVGIGSLASIALVIFACGSKGSGDDSSVQNGGTGNSASGGSSGTVSAGTGGTTAIGGSAAGGTSGSTSIAGTGGGSGGERTITQSYDFDTTVEGWTTISSSTDGSDTTLMPVDKTMVKATWTDTDGDPMPGALQLEIPYSSKSQYVSIGINIGMSDPTKPKVDFTGIKTVTAFVKIVSGLESTAELLSAPPGAQIYIKVGPDYDYANSVYTNITALDTWVPVTLTLDNPSYLADAGAYDLSDVRELGVQINSSGTTTTAAPAVVLIDTVAY